MTTMREEFEKHMASLPTGDASAESPAWSAWQAAYVAGQKAADERASRIASRYPKILPPRHTTKNLLPRASGRHEGIQTASQNIAFAILDRKTHP